MSKSIAVPSMYVMTTHLHHMQNLTARVDATLRLRSFQSMWRVNLIAILMMMYFTGVRTVYVLSIE